MRFSRPGLVEEYTVSINGVQQDFVVRERPGGVGELAVRLALSGAKVEPAIFGAQLVLENSRRKIAYSQLRVTDATGKELSARMEVEPDATANDRYAPMLAVVVNDADAMYPVRIDPTFSDANWISMNPSIPGANYQVRAVVVDGSGNLYIGGDFTIVGDVFANYIAKWNGSSWSALGSGMNDFVGALAVVGSDVYAGGAFTTAGGGEANNIAKWDGTSWSALGSGVGSGFFEPVYALAASGSDLYAGGGFTTAGGKVSADIARAYLPTLPALSVLQSSAGVMVSWPSAETTDFALEQADTLGAPASWVTNADSVIDDGTNKSVTLPATNCLHLFRLRRP